MIRRRWLVLMLLVLAIALPVADSAATTVVSVSDVDLVNRATDIVVARVLTINSGWQPAARQVFTDVTIAIDEVLVGDLPNRRLTVRLPGGRLGALDVLVEGTPTFERGERVVLFLRLGTDGRFRVVHLFQGKFSVVISELTGEELALRIADPGVNVLPVAGATGRLVTGDVRRLEDIRRLVRLLRSAPWPSAARATATDDPATESSGAYTFLGSPSRWFEPDSGLPVTMLIDGNGEPLAPTRGFSQVRDAFAVWNTITDSAFRFRDGGTTTPRGAALDGVNAISFRDPLGQIDPPSACSGTLALTVFYRSTSETRTVNGQSFFRILEADVVTADGWQGCDFYENYANMAEVMTHELGHVLGLGHSGEPDATMAPFAHFDGRGAALHPDDEAGVRFSYPEPVLATLTVTRSGTGTGTVTSSPSGIDCGSACSQTFAGGATVTLSASPAAGSMFAGWNGACSGTGACTVAMTSDVGVGATFNLAPVTFSFTTPAAGANVTGNVTVGFTASGGSGGYTYRVTIDGVQVYAGTTPSFTWNTTAYPDGGRTLVGTVTDSAGRTASQNRTVTIANTASFTASITYPNEGMTVPASVRVGMSTTAPWGRTKTWVLYVDSTELTRVTNTGTTFWYTWDTTRTPNGARTLRLEITITGQTAVASRGVNVANAGGGTGTPPPPPPLTATFTAPAAGATVSGTATVGMSSSGSPGPLTFALSVDGTEVSRQTVSGTTASYAWNTTTAANGSHTLSLTVTDGSGRTATTTRQVTVSNTGASGTATFTVSFQNPANGATLSGNKSVGMATSAPWGQSKTWVLLLDGAAIMRQTTTGTTLWWTWNTRTAPNGEHELTLAITDTNGRTATARITVRIAN